MHRRTTQFLNEWAKRRVYFYEVDLRGRLFLEEAVTSTQVRRRNDATCLRDAAFLDFFFKRLQPSSSSSSPFAKRWEEPLRLFAGEYAWMSPCGKELNLIRAEDTPVVYRDLVQQEGDELSWWLTYAGSLRQEFDPARLGVKKDTGRLYYCSGGDNVGLLHPDLAQRLSTNLTIDEDSRVWFNWQGKEHAVGAL